MAPAPAQSIRRKGGESLHFWKGMNQGEVEKKKREEKEDTRASEKAIPA